MLSTDSKLLQAQAMMAGKASKIPETKRMIIKLGPKPAYDPVQSQLMCPICDKPTNNRDPHDYSKPAPCNILCAKKQAWFNICPPLFRETNVFKLPNPRAYEEVMAWKYGPEGLLLVGASRLGKSRSAYCLLYRLFEAGKIIRVFGGGEFEDQYGKATYNGNGISWLKSVATADIIYFDDLGKGVLTERADSGLWRLVNLRAEQMLPIIITTNSNGSNMLDITSTNRGESLVARLREFCQIIDFGNK